MLAEEAFRADGPSKLYNQNGPLRDTINFLAGWVDKFRGICNMTRLSFDEGREEIVSLLQAGMEEFDSGNRFVALSILLEAQCALSEMFQNEIENAERRLRSLH